MMVILLLEGVGGFVVLWAIFYFFFARKRKEEPVKPSTFPLPTPRIDKSRLENISSDLLELGFMFINNFDKGNYGLWPSPVKLYAHRDVAAFAEIAVMPTEEIQVQFISFFPAGSVMTTAGDRQVTLRYFSPRDAEFWEAGNLATVWRMHLEHMREYEGQRNRSPLPVNEEAYLDFLNIQKLSIRELLKGEKFIPRTLNDYLLMGYLFLNDARTLEALEMFQGAINLDSDKSFLHKMAGRISLFVGDFEAASQYLYEAVDLDPQDRDNYPLLAEALVRLEKKKSALEILKRGHEILPDDRDISFHLGILATEMGELDVASANLEPLEGMVSPSHTLFKALADLHSKLGDAKKAKGYARLARVFAKQKEEWKSLSWR